MITVSHNEVVVACQKVFEALGFDQGQWEDAGDALGWLAVHGLPFPADFASRLDTIRPADTLPKMINEEPGKPVWEAAGLSALSYFPILADYASVHAKRFGKCQILIKNCRDIDLIWPYALKIYLRGFVVSLCWKIGQETVQAVDLGSKTEIYSCNGKLPMGRAELTVWNRFRSNDVEKSTLPSEKEQLIDEETLQQNYLHHTEHGIEIDLALWEKLSEIGKGILVEATEESEKRGAGGV